MADEPKKPAAGGESDDIDSLLKAIQETKKQGPAPAPKEPARPGAAADDEIARLLAGTPPPAPPAAAGKKAPPAPGGLQKPAFPPVDTVVAGTAEGGLDLLKDVNLHVKVELGRCRMRVRDILQLSPGAVVPLDKLAGDPLDVHVNGRLVARGEVLILKDNFCLRITEIIAPAK